ncbi:hypothetical protein B484DRAFT_408539 [Ochromonadaceae sp. CCMP2298]|nr:hypothetical protein B484DRAFT_408539 [Ochromonadaceae sp. CCMP2298]
MGVMGMGGGGMGMGGGGMGGQGMGAGGQGMGGQGMGVGSMGVGIMGMGGQGMVGGGTGMGVMGMGELLRVLQNTFPRLEEKELLPEMLRLFKTPTQEGLLQKVIPGLWMAAVLRKDRNWLIQFGSILRGLTGMQRREMEAFVQCTISKGIFAEMGLHAAQSEGAGAVVKDGGVQNRGQQRKLQTIRAFIAYLIEVGVKTANVREYRDSNCKPHTLPQIYRREAIGYLMRQFVYNQKVLRNMTELQIEEGRPENRGERLYLGIKEAEMKLVTKIVCPSKLKSLGALDVNSEVHGRQNFRKLKELMLLLALR